MKVLIIGGGGREHALCWKAARSAAVRQVYVAPGNAGTAREPGVENVPIAADDLDALAAFARDRAIDLTIVGPEGPLVAGIVDVFSGAGLRCFGPSRAAAALEGSKSFSKDFLARRGIPTAAYGTFTELDAAVAYIRGRGAPIVVKADGLAAGKGVVVATDAEQAVAAATDMLSANRFGEAGHRIVVEEFLRGEEASFIVLCDGRTAVPLAASQDHKARDDGDRGPNTGGMGAYSPAPVVTPDVHRRIMEEVIVPTMRGMADEGCPYTGFLYAGLMIAPDGSPRVLEFNCRLGDPETEPLLMRLRGDLVQLCAAASDGELDGRAVDWDPRTALGVVLAAEGYPGEVRKGDPIEGLDQTFAPDVKVFHAGTAERDGTVITAGGRVLCVTALGDDVESARRLAYDAAGRIHWRGRFFRSDIGHRAIGRESGGRS
jgi:phosphoribosylamine--glycine ligase